MWSKKKYQKWIIKSVKEESPQILMPQNLCRMKKKKKKKKREKKKKRKKKLAYVHT